LPGPGYGDIAIVPTAVRVAWQLAEKALSRRFP
jgi:hypothetical protein